MKSPRLVLAASLLLAIAPQHSPAQTPEAPKIELPASSQSGAPILFELWSWGSDETTRKKVLDFKEGDKIAVENLPDECQFRWRIGADHNGVVFKARSADGVARHGWESKNIQPGAEPAAQKLYKAQSGPIFPQPCRYTFEITADKDGVKVAEVVANVEFTKAPLKPVVFPATYAETVGPIKPFPKTRHLGAEVEYEICQWSGQKDLNKDAKKLVAIKDGAKIPVEGLSQSINFRFRIAADYDSISYRCLTSDNIPESQWAKQNLTPEESGPGKLYKAGNLGVFPQIGRYCIEVKAEKDGKVVVDDCTNFELISGKPIPRDTHFMEGKKDWAGTPITTSKPVSLGALNETPVLRDNDYALEPQKAFQVVNWERFPPFNLHPRFPLVWASRRFLEEDQFGGPLNRGFTTVATVDKRIDNLKVSERSHFDYPGHLEQEIDGLLKTDPVKYSDLKRYKDHRLPFVSEENAIMLGRKIYEGWGAAGWAPYDSGIYAWDEEELFAPQATLKMKSHPDSLPERLLAYKDKVLAKDPGAIFVLEKEALKAIGDFVGNTYRGAREAAAARGRNIKIWHYGTASPATELFTYVGNNPDVQPNPKTGKYPYESIDSLHSYFKRGNSIDFNASPFSREIDYFHTDFYYMVIFPDKLTMYAKDKAGQDVLDDKGRRKIRNDYVEETMYAEPVKLGDADFEWSPIFLKTFIAKGENNQFWFNGGKYYKTHGTQITDKQVLPYIRPGNQETFGEASKLGSRPVSPYMAEASSIFTFMIGSEGMFLWDARNHAGPVGFGKEGKSGQRDSLADLEFIVKGLHRVSQFNQLFEGSYSFIRPTRHYNTHDRDHPIIRGILNGQYLLLGMTNPYLDPTEAQAVEVWYDSPYTEKTRNWSDKVTIQSRKNHLFQCKLPALPSGQSYDPDKLYFRYVCADGKYSRAYTVSGNYDVKYPYPQ